MGKNALAHRVIWKMFFGSNPETIDHINGSGCDNRLENLRAATNTINLRNCSISINNNSGFTGVHFDKNRKMWVAFATVNRKRKHIGRFKNMKDAVYARKEFDRKNGFHENHGRPKP